MLGSFVIFLAISAGAAVGIPHGRPVLRSGETAAHGIASRSNVGVTGSAFAEPTRPELRSGEGPGRPRNRSNPLPLAKRGIDPRPLGPAGLGGGLLLLRSYPKPAIIRRTTGGESRRDGNSLGVLQPDGVVCTSSVTASIAVTHVFAPTDITGLMYWFDAADSATMWTTTGEVTQCDTGSNFQCGRWKDKSGNLRHADTVGGGAERPELVVSQINGHTALRGTTAQFLQTTATPSTSQVLTVVVVCCAADSGAGAGVAYDFVNFGWAMYFPAAMSYSADSTNFPTRTTLADVSIPAIYTVKFNAASSTDRVDGIESTTKNAGTKGATNTTFTLFNYAMAAVQGLNGPIGEICVYSGTLTAANHAAIEGYLAAKWGTQLQGISGATSNALSPLNHAETGTITGGGTPVTGVTSNALSPIAHAETGTETFTGTTTNALSPIDHAEVAVEAMIGTSANALSPLAHAETAVEAMIGVTANALAPLAHTEAGTETFTGTTSNALAPLAHSETATETFTGTTTNALQPLAHAETATLGFIGTSSNALAPLAHTETGTETMSGTTANALSPLDHAEVGSCAAAVTGTCTNALSPVAHSEVAVETFTGVAANALQPLAHTEAGSVANPVTGTCSNALSPLDHAETGSAGTPPVTGTTSNALSPLAHAETGTETMSGTCANALAPLAHSEAAALGFIGVSSNALSSLAWSAVGALGFIGVTSHALSALSHAETGTHTPQAVTGTGTWALSPLAHGEVGTQAGSAIAGTVANALSPLAQTAAGATFFPPVSPWTIRVDETRTGALTIAILTAPMIDPNDTRAVSVATRTDAAIDPGDTNL